MCMLAQASGSLTANLLELIPKCRNNESSLNEDNASQSRQTVKFAIGKLGLVMGISREAKTQKEPEHPCFKAWLSTAPIIPSLLRSDQAREFM